MRLLQPNSLFSLSKYAFGWTWAILLRPQLHSICTEFALMVYIPSEIAMCVIAYERIRIWDSYLAREQYVNYINRVIWSGDMMIELCFDLCGFYDSIFCCCHFFTLCTFIQWSKQYQMPAKTISLMFSFLVSSNCIHMVRSSVSLKTFTWWKLHYSAHGGHPLASKMRRN